MEPLGEGGFGRVYRARNKKGEDIALKVLRNLEFTDRAVAAQFREEPTLSAKLSPDYVVKVLEVGEHQGLPYFTMEYMNGGTLRERASEYRGSPERAARLMIEIATAVQHLHVDPEHPERQPILHRDLKPENILFDAKGRPKISDFGVAKLAKDNTWTVGTRVVGCPAYMAPEQVYPTPRRELTAAADVYALGAILYELFTGRPPFDGTDTQILAQLKDDEPIAPRHLVPALDRFLETVVLNALEKDPARRYRSAAGFANDLTRALKAEPPEEVPPVPISTRIRLRLKRHPLVIAACIWVLSLVAVVGVTAHSTLAARAETLERDQATNATVAGMQSVAVNLQLRAYEHRIAELSQDAEILALLDSAPPGGLSATLAEHRAPFDTMFVMKPDGRQSARTSVKSTQYLERSFEFRDYFRGARRLGQVNCVNGASARRAGGKRRAHLARAFTSEADGRFEFAISAPLCRGTEWAGVLAGTIATDKVLGAVRVLDDRNARIAAVLGPRDRDRNNANGPLPNDITFIVHPGLAHGDARRLLEPAPAALRAALGLASLGDDGENPDSGQLRYAAPFRVDDYRDPIAGFEGAWSAVFAAADESGFIVAVQSRRDATPLVPVLFQKLALPAGVPFAAALFALLSIALTRRRNAWPSGFALAPAPR